MGAVQASKSVSLFVADAYYSGNGATEQLGLYDNARTAACG